MHDSRSELGTTDITSLEGWLLFQGSLVAEQDRVFAPFGQRSSLHSDTARALDSLASRTTFYHLNNSIPFRQPTILPLAKRDSFQDIPLRLGERYIILALADGHFCRVRQTACLTQQRPEKALQHLTTIVQKSALPSEVIHCQRYLQVSGHYNALGRRAPHPIKASVSLSLRLQQAQGDSATRTQPLQWLAPRVTEWAPSN